MNQIDQLIKGMCDCEITDSEPMYIDLERGDHHQQQEYFICTDMYLESPPLKKQKVDGVKTTFEEYMQFFNLTKTIAPEVQSRDHFVQRVKQDFRKYQEELKKNA